MMENAKLNEYESLELITKMIERAKHTEIGRLNFVTLYGMLGLVMFTVSLVKPEPPYTLSWSVVAATSYAVPFAYHKMWRKQMTVTGSIVKRGWGLLALAGILTPFIGNLEAPQCVAALMVAIGSCMLFMLSGIYKLKAILIAAFIGLCSSIMAIISGGFHNASWVFWAYVFFAYCVYIGLSLHGNVDEIRTF